MTKAIVFCMFPVWVFVSTAAYAATCDAGYYLENGNCVLCNPNREPFYCPGDDMKYKCPTTDTDYNQFGYTFIGGKEAGYTSAKSWRPGSCVGQLDFKDEYGNVFRMESAFNGENYWGTNKEYYKAGAGYYLSGYRATSYSKDWYDTVKACTNIVPVHAHYSGPGTPDEPKSGGATDYNDCPWACDDGYGVHDDACVPLCASGVSTIKTDRGLSFNLYPVAYSVPSFAVLYNNVVCYGVLSPGDITPGINISHAGSVYHMEN